MGTGSSEPRTFDSQVATDKQGSVGSQQRGRVAKLADARDLKSRGGFPPCGFDPRLGHCGRAECDGGIAVARNAGIPYSSGR